MKINWIKDTLCEHVMAKQHGFEFHLEKNFRVKDINLEKSHRNNARFNKAVSDYIALEYSGRMNAGNPFYPIVIWKDQVLSGNHRVGGVIKLGIDVVDAYVVDKADTAEIDKFVRTINTVTNGLQLTDEQRVAQAVHFVEKCNMSAKDAAVMLFGGRWEDKCREINELCKRAYVKDQLIQHGVKIERIDHIMDKMPNLFGVLYTLNPRENHGGVKTPLIQRDAFQAVCDAKMDQVTAQAMVSEIKKAANDKARREVIHATTERVKTEEARGYSPNSTLFRQGIARMHKVLCEQPNEAVISSFGDLSIEDKDEKKAHMKHIKAVVSALNRIEKSFKKENKR